MKSVRDEDGMGSDVAPFPWLRDYGVRKERQAGETLLPQLRLQTTAM
jgi:hypothetical protein